MSAADLVNGRITRPYDFKRVALEARILEAKKTALRRRRCAGQRSRDAARGNPAQLHRQAR